MHSPRRRPQKGDDDWDIDESEDEEEIQKSGSSARRASSASASLHVPYPKHQGEEGINLINHEERVLHQTGARLPPGDRQLISRTPSLRSDDYGEWEEAPHQREL